MHKANFGQRLIAELVEQVIAFLPVFYFVYTIWQQRGTDEIFNTGITGIIFMVWYGLVLLFVRPYLISKSGGSFGKLILGLKITNENGEKLTFWRAFFREITKRISSTFFFLGYFWMLRDPQKQTWHDMASGSIVVVNR